MLTKILYKELVCWPHKTVRGAVEEAKIFERGEKVSVRANAERIGQARMAVVVRGEILFCDRNQFWNAVQ